MYFSLFLYVQIYIPVHVMPADFICAGFLSRGKYTVCNLYGALHRFESLIGHEVRK